MKDAPVMVILRKLDKPYSQLSTLLEDQIEVLLLKRHGDHPLFPNEWCLPGGKREIAQVWSNNNHMLVDSDEYSESNEEAIYRECQEELGANIYVFKDTEVIMIDDRYQMKVYLAISKVQITKEFPNREHVEYDWFDLKELPKKTSSVTRDLLENYEF